MSARTYDWKPATYDPLSLNFLAADLAKPRPLRSHLWRCVTRLDQGQEGACVGFGWADTLGSSPKPQLVNDQAAFEIYNLAKTLDDTPGTDYSGTSVLAGAKACQQLGRISSYWWCPDLQSLLQVLAWTGPVTIGVWWREGMEEADDADQIHATGAVVGGHCVSVHEIRVADRLVRIRNSWGSTWGRRGDAFLSWTDLELLLNDQGEACVGVKVEF